MEFLRNIINKLNPSAKKGIGIFISPDSTMEIVEYDYDLGEINNYSKIDFEYNAIKREINLESFELTLQNILKNFEITPQIPITLAIPSIFISKKILPSELQREEVNTALISETEKNYIFKKAEPSVSWNVISTDKNSQLDTILYSAVQKNLIEGVDNVFKRQGLKLVAVDISYAAFIRGLSVSGLLDDCIEKNLNWCTLVIKNNTNAVINLKGSQVLNILESPLALNSLETNDLYSTLSSGLQEKIETPTVETLAIINYSNIVDINNLSTYFDFKCPIIKIQNNKFNGEAIFTSGISPTKTNPAPEIITVESINPEVIGASCWKNAPVKLGFNFLSTQGQDEMPGFLASLGLVGNPLHLILLGLIAAAFCLITLISLIGLPINISLDDQYKQAFVKCSQYEAKFAKPQTKVFNLYDIVMDNYTKNEKIITSYDSISAVIPEKVWVSSIKIDENLNANITGKAYCVEDIVSYYENLVNVSKFNNLKIKSIKVVNESTEVPGTATPDVSVNTIPNNPNATSNNLLPGVPTNPNQGGDTSLPPPPPPSSLTSGSSIAGVSGLKYYEFDFGNPTEVKPETKEQTQQNPIIPGLSELSKNLNIGKQN